MKKTFTLLLAKDPVFNATIMGEQFPLGCYEEVYSFNKELYPTPDHVFMEAQNVIELWRPEAPCRSASVGDLIVNDETGEILMISHLGFEDFTLQGN